MVDGAKLLVALPGDVDFVGRIAGVEASGDLGLLAVGEMFHAVAEEPADLIERVVLVPASPRVSCWTRRRTSSTTWVPSLTT